VGHAARMTEKTEAKRERVSNFEALREYVRIEKRTLERSRVLCVCATVEESIVFGVSQTRNRWGGTVNTELIP
jgi:hypothetical protein